MRQKFRQSGANPPEVANFTLGEKFGEFFHMAKISAYTVYVLVPDSTTFILQFFKLDVLYECDDGTLAVAPSSYIIEQLHNIIKMTSDPSSDPVGILTSDHRDTWAKSRERLVKGGPQIMIHLPVAQYYSRV